MFTIKLTIFQFSPRLEDYPQCEGSAGNCGVLLVSMSTYFTTDDTEIEMHADAPSLNAAPEFIGLSPRRAAQEMTEL